MVNGYVLDAGTLDVALNASDRLEVYIGATPYEIENVGGAPPGGQLPVYPGPSLVPFIFRSVATWDSIANDIRDRFGTLVADAKSLPTQFDNAPPVGAFPAMWARVEVAFQGSEALTISGATRTFRATGDMVVTLRQPLGAGDGDLLNCIDDIDAAFRGVTDGDIIYGTPSVTLQGVSDGPWWMTELRVPFRADRGLAVVTGSATAVLDFESASNAIRSRFGTLVEDALSLTVQYDNEPPVGQDDERWIRCVVRMGGSFPVGIASGSVGRVRRSGLLISQLFAPLREGDGDLYAIADTIDDAFRAVSAGGVTYRSPKVSPVGATPDGKWWQVNVSCPFYFDVTT